jgi:hypothetical protein
MLLWYWLPCTPHLLKYSVSIFLFTLTLLRSPKQLLWSRRFCKAVGYNSTHCCTFQQQLPSWLQSSVCFLHAVIIWYGLISLKFLSLQFIAKCPYLSHNQHTVSVFSSLFDCPTVAFVPCTDSSIFSAVELTKNTYLGNTYSSGVSV